MLVEKAREKWDKKHDLNCAECIMYAANEEYNLSNRKCMWCSNWGSRCFRPYVYRG